MNLLKVNPLLKPKTPSYSRQRHDLSISQLKPLSAHLRCSVEPHIVRRIAIYRRREESVSRYRLIPGVNGGLNCLPCSVRVLDLTDVVNAARDENVDGNFRA